MAEKEAPGALFPDEERGESDEDLTRSSVEDPPDVLAAVDRLTGAVAALLATPVAEPAAGARDEVAGQLIEAIGSTDPAAALVDRLGPLLTDEPADAALLEIWVGAVASMDPTAQVGGRKLVQQLTDEVDDERLSRDLAAALDVLKGKKELPVFREDTGLRSVKALILFALRPEPHDTVSWWSEMAADPATVVVASAVAGVRTGWSRLPTDLRGGRETSSVMSRLIAAALDPAAGSAWARGIEMPAGAVAPESVPEEVARRLSDADLADSVVARAATAVCRRMDWSDLVATEVTVGEEGFRYVDGHLEVAGPVEVRRRIAPEIIERLRSTGADAAGPEFDHLLEVLRYSD